MKSAAFMDGTSRSLQSHVEQRALRGWLSRQTEDKRHGYGLYRD
jgi:hypothetical protein